MPKKFSQVTQMFYKRVEKKRGPYCNNIGRTGLAYEGGSIQFFRVNTRYVAINNIVIASKSRHYLFCFSKIKKILGTGNLTGSFTGAFFANTVFLIFAKFKKNL